MKPVLERLGAALSYGRVFQSPHDFYVYMRLRRSYGAGHRVDEPATLRLRSLGGAPVLMRGSQDVWTLKHTFVAGFHHPPQALPDDAVILDLGANVGYTVADLAYRYPRARILGVEMDARNFELARHNTATFGSRVQLVHAAVWDSDGVVEYDPTCGEDAFAVQAAPSDAGARASVPARRIETLLDEHGIDRVDYVKMDVEGAEATLLEGDVSWLDRVDSIKIEIHPPATSERCRAVLDAHGFRTWVDPHHWDTVCAVRGEPSERPRRSASRA